MEVDVAVAVGVAVGVAVVVGVSCHRRSSGCSQ